MKPVFTYRVTPPDEREPFFAMVADDDGTIVTLSTREDGNWRPDSDFNYYDLMMPEFELNEWDIEKIDTGDAPNVYERKVHPAVLKARQILKKE